MGPWVGFNQSRFQEPTFISTNDGIAILGSTCDAVFSGRAIGLVQWPKQRISCGGREKLGVGGRHEALMAHDGGIYQRLYLLQQLAEPSAG